MLFVLVVGSIFFCRPGFVTDVAFISEVVPVPHVSPALRPALKPSTVAFEIGRPMVGCATVAIPCSPARGECLTAGAAFIIVDAHHDDFLPNRNNAKKARDEKVVVEKKKVELVAESEGSWRVRKPRGRFETGKRAVKRVREFVWNLVAVGGLGGCWLLLLPCYRTCCLKWSCIHHPCVQVSGPYPMLSSNQ